MADQEIGKLVIKIVADMKEMQKQFSEAKKDVKDLADKSVKAQQGLTAAIGEVKSGYLDFAAKVTTVYLAVKKAMDWAEIGARAEAVAESFNAVTKSIGVDGEKLISDIKKAAYTYVDSTDIMQTANRLLAEGVEANDIPKLFEAARVAARIMGIEVPEAMRFVEEAVVSLRTRGLRRAFPMEDQKVFKAFADSIKVDADMLGELGKRQAIVNEILTQAVEKTALLGGKLLPQHSEELQKLNSAIKESKELIGKMIVEGIAPAISAYKEWGGVISDLIEKYEKLPKAVQDAAKIIIASGVPFLGPILRQFAVEQVLTEPQKALKALEKAMEEETKWVEKGLAGQDAKEKGRKEREYKDQDKHQKEMIKLRLDAEKARVDAANQIRMYGLEAEREQTIAGAKLVSEDVFTTEQEYARRRAEMELENTKASIKAQMDLQIAAAEAEGKTREIPAIREKARQAELVAVKKFNTEITKIEADETKRRGEAVRKSLELLYADIGEFEAPPTEKETEESAKRLRTLTTEHEKQLADWQQQLAELGGNYWDVVEAEKKVIDAELQSVLAAKDYNDEEKKIIKQLYEEKKARLENTENPRESSRCYAVKRPARRDEGRLGGHLRCPDRIFKN